MNRNDTALFDLMANVPETDEQVEIALARHYKDKPLGGILISRLNSLYYVYREQGNTIVEAWKRVLEICYVAFNEQPR